MAVEDAELMNDGKAAQAVADEVLRALRKAQERERPASPALLDALSRASLSSLIAGKRAFSLDLSVELQELERWEQRIGRELDPGLKREVRRRLPARLEAAATDGVTVDLDRAEMIAAWREAATMLCEELYTNACRCERAAIIGLPASAADLDQIRAVIAAGLHVCGDCAAPPE